MTLQRDVQPAREVAQSTGYSAYWIGQIAQRYNTEGSEGVVNRHQIISHRATPILARRSVIWRLWVSAGRARAWLGG